MRTPRKIKRTGSARTQQPELLHTTVRHLLDQDAQICSGCGGKLYTNGDKCERSERITVCERVYTVVTDEKQVYGCGGCGRNESAQSPGSRDGSSRTADHATSDVRPTRGAREVVRAELQTFDIH